MSRPQAPVVWTIRMTSQYGVGFFLLNMDNVSQTWCEMKQEGKLGNAGKDGNVELFFL